MHHHLVGATFRENVAPVSQLDALREVIERNLVDASATINGHQLGERADECLRGLFEGLVFARQVPVATVAWIQHVAYGVPSLHLHTEVNVRTGERSAVNGSNVVAHSEQPHTVWTVECGAQILETKIVCVISNGEHVLHSSLDSVQIDEPVCETLDTDEPNHL